MCDCFRPESVVDILQILFSSLTFQTDRLSSTPIGTRRRILWMFGIGFLSIVVFVALVRVNVLPPPKVLEYQFGLTPKPILGKQVVHLKGWGWYPILQVKESNSGGASVTFVKFLPLTEPASRPITLTHRAESLPDNFFSMDKQYPWGTARFVKPNTLQSKNVHVAWLAGREIYLSAPSEAELLKALSLLDLTSK